MEYHILDVVVPVSLTVLLLVLVFTIAVCKYKRCMNMGKDAALRRHRKLWMTCGSLGNDYPSRSTTEQSLYSPTFDVQKTDTSSSDIGIQTSQILFPLDMSNHSVESENVSNKSETTELTDNETNKEATRKQSENKDELLSCKEIITHCYPDQHKNGNTTDFNHSCQPFKVKTRGKNELKTRQTFSALIHSHDCERGRSLCEENNQIENLLCEQSISCGDLVQKYSEDAMLLPQEKQL